MRVLQVHNFYGSSSPSGENDAVKLERDLLLSRGVEVEVFYKHSDTIIGAGLKGKITGGLSSIMNPAAAAELNVAASRFRPDVVHFHNVFPLISPSAIAGLDRRWPRVLTLHNLRTFCANGVAMREQQVCTKCLDQKSVIPAIVHGCYRESRLATLPLAASIALRRALGTWNTSVDTFIVLSDYHKALFVDAGIGARRLAVKPNFHPGPVPPPGPFSQRQGAVFVGRLGAEKGIIPLVKAWALWGDAAPSLRIVGDGPLAAEARAMAEAANANIDFLGRVTAQKAEQHIRTSKLLIVPSTCIEGFPLVMRDAFSAGVAMAVSDVGALPELVRENAAGVVFTPGEPEDMVSALRSFWTDQPAVESGGRNAYSAYLAKFTADANFDRLMTIYADAIISRSSR